MPQVNLHRRAEIAWRHLQPHDQVRVEKALTQLAEVGHSGLLGGSRVIRLRDPDRRLFAYRIGTKYRLVFRLSSEEGKIEVLDILRAGDSRYYAYGLRS